ncbi:restriction endonuclease subunit S [Mycoplasma sp. Z355B]|uniref:restriction endonuclease subunit S n=1 Tax=Mycoplasma sp. Z355B TaxID=3401689 RepID=UPI003AAA52E5
MEKEKLVPAIRFSGYYRKWNLKTLEEIAKITFGQSPLSIYYSDKKTDHILVQGNADVKNRWVYPRIYTSQITKKAFVGDIIFSVRAPVGSVAKTNYDIVIGRGVAAIKGDNFIYFNLLWKEISQFWESKSSGSTFDSITSLELAQSEITIPSDLSEQQKIGQFFSKLDFLIRSQELKLEKLQIIKQSLLNKMFTYTPGKLPEISFKGSEGESWQFSKLNSFVTKGVDNRGFTPKYCNKGPHPIIEVASLGNISPNYSKVVKYLSETTFNSELRGYVEQGDILFSTVGAIGSVSIMDNNLQACIAQNVIGLRAKDNFNYNFIYQLFCNEKNKKLTNSIVMSAVQPSIKVSQLFQLDYLITLDIAEQRKIGLFLISLDSLIRSQEQKLEKLNNIKQALLEKMFC